MATVITVMFVALIAFNISIANDNNKIKTQFHRIESLSDENCPHTAGYTQKSVWYNNKRITCCCVSSDMNACNFSMEDSDCNKINHNEKYNILFYILHVFIFM
ncbi:MAG: hypothetical protein LBG92_07140 [Prevotellaceae bacterium]|nr:hypothetical protein [Prevotellaceae bacterium]